MPVTDYDALLEPLFRVFGRGRPKAAFIDTSADYANALRPFGWIDDGILAAAVEDCTRYLEALPTPKELIAVCRDTKQARDLAAQREAEKLLPPPAGNVVPADELDEQDEWACTAEERERWAHEDVWCRGYAKTLDPNPPPHATEAELDYWRRNWSVANWPKLTPRQRRAKERRINAEMGGAMAHLGRRFEVARSIPQRPTPPAPAQGHAAVPEWPGAVEQKQETDDLAHVPDGDGPDAGDWLAGLGAGAGNAGTTQTGGRD